MPHCKKIVAIGYFLEMIAAVIVPAAMVLTIVRQVAAVTRAAVLEHPANWDQTEVH